METDGREDAPPKNGAKHPDQSKRKLLRLIVLAGVGGAVAVLLLGSSVRNTSNLTYQSTQSQELTTSQLGTATSYANRGSMKVNVRFFQMSQVIPVTQEYFVIQSPAQYSDLLSAVESKYPVIAGMILNMLVLVDGIPAKPGTPLQDGVEVDFIPAIAGG